MRRKQQTELQELERGLQTADERADLIPAQMATTLSALSMEQLEAIIQRGNNLVSLVMAQKGWAFMEIKHRVGHGNFKRHLVERDFEYTYAAKCMNVARAVAKHPDLVKIPDAHLLRRIAYLPDEKQAAIEVKFKQITEKVEGDEIVKETREWTDLRPWILAEIGHKFTKKHDRPRPEHALPLPDITPLDTLMVALTSAINQVAHYTIPKAEHARARRYADEIARLWDACIWNLADPAHKSPPPWALGNSDDITPLDGEEED